MTLPNHSLNNAGLAQLGERQTEVKLREIYLKVMCSIHINRTLIFCFVCVGCTSHEDIFNILFCFHGMLIFF